MTTDIQETINRLRELDRYASPAPWSSQRGFISAGQASLDITNDKQGFPLMRLWADMTKGDREVNPQDDFTLIIETRNALPAILAEIDRLQKSERALKDRFARIFNTWRSRRPELIRKTADQLEPGTEFYGVLKTSEPDGVAPELMLRTQGHVLHLDDYTISQMSPRNFEVVKVVGVYGTFHEPEGE